MKGVNKFIGLGNLGRDPETRYTNDGKSITNFSLAIDDSYTPKNGAKVDRVEWVNIVCFAKLAEIAGEYLRKGSKVYVEGSLRTSSWEKDGQKKYKTEVIARELQMLDSKRTSDRPSTEQGPPVDDYVESDVPF